MIEVTKLNGDACVLNADLIEMVESTPDTLVSLTTGRKLMVRDSVDDVVRRSIEYRGRIRGAYPVSVPLPADDEE